MKNKTQYIVNNNERSYRDDEQSYDEPETKDYRMGTLIIFKAPHGTKEEAKVRF